MWTAMADRKSSSISKTHRDHWRPLGGPDAVAMAGPRRLVHASDCGSGRRWFGGDRGCSGGREPPLPWSSALSRVASVACQRTEAGVEGESGAGTFVPAPASLRVCNRLPNLKITSGVPNAHAPIRGDNHTSQADKDTRSPAAHKPAAARKRPAAHKPPGAHKPVAAPRTPAAPPEHTPAAS